jgi:hypothetical protein
LNPMPSAVFSSPAHLVGTLARELLEASLEGGSDKLMSYNTPEDRIRDEQVRRLSTDQDPRGRQHRKDVYRVDLKPKKAKTRNCKEEERVRLKMLTYEQAND